MFSNKRKLPTGDSDPSVPTYHGTTNMMVVYQDPQNESENNRKKSETDENDTLVGFKGSKAKGRNKKIKMTVSPNPQQIFSCLPSWIKEIDNNDGNRWKRLMQCIYELQQDKDALLEKEKELEFLMKFVTNSDHRKKVSVSDAKTKEIVVESDKSSNNMKLLHTDTQSMSKYDRLSGNFS